MEIYHTGLQNAVHNIVFSFAHHYQPLDLQDTDVYDQAVK